MPHLQKMYAGLRAQGCEVISVNHGDSAEVINRFVNESKLSFPVLMDQRGSDIAKLYGVGAYPTNYLIKDGKVFATLVGFDEKALKASLAKLGFRVD